MQWLWPALNRRQARVAGAIAFAVLATVLAYGPLVRGVVSARARAKHLSVDVRAVRPAWMAVRLLGVSVQADGVPGIQVAVDEVRVRLQWNLRFAAVNVRGLRVTASGPEAALRAQVDAWRALRASTPGAPPSHEGPAIEVDDGSVAWAEADPGGQRATLDGISAHLQEGRWTVSCSGLQVRFGGIHLVAEDAGISARAGIIDSAHASSFVFEAMLSNHRADSRASRDASPAESAASGSAFSGSPSSVLSGAPNSASSSGGASPPRASGGSISPSASATRASASNSGQARRRPTPEEPPHRSAWSTVQAPDLAALRRKVDGWSRIFQSLLAPGADVHIDALRWTVSRPDDTAATLTIGPGPFAVTRSGSAVEMRFTTDPRTAGTPLSVVLTLPTAAEDIALTVDGGPLTLAQLGIHNGAFGLVDVDRASATGHARAALAGDGNALTFDVDAATHGLALDNPRLAADVVRGVDLHLRTHGAWSTSGELRVDELTAALGALQLTGSGTLQQDADHVEGGLHFEIPTASCHALLDSVPAALLPVLDGAEITGTFGATGHVAFDSRSLDDLVLEYTVRDRCDFGDVPPELAHGRFSQPFEHRIYLPDGNIGEQTTGPGTDEWTPLEDISPYMEVAVLTTEDGAFLHHHGFNKAAIRASIIANLKAGRFIRGASTITMQLAKNLFLSRDKTLARKLEEVVLAEYLEQAFTKEELMELYLNVIEFGPSVYGITAAADYYFGRTPGELNLAECLFLSSLLPSPIRYGAIRDSATVPDSRMRTLHMLMETAHRYGRISDAELAEGEAQTLQFWHGGDRPPPRARVDNRPRFTGDADDMTTAPTPTDDAPPP